MLSLSEAYQEKIENLATMIQEKAGLGRFSLLYPGMGINQSELAWLHMPNLSELVGIDSCYKSDSTFRGQAVALANAMGIELKLLAEDATKPSEYTDGNYDVIIDKRGIRSLKPQDTTYGQSADDIRARLQVVFPSTNYFGEPRENVVCKVTPRGGSFILCLVDSDEGDVEQVFTIDELESEPPNQALIRDKIKDLEFGPEITKLWMSYLSVLKVGGVVVSYDPLSHYLLDLGMKEIQLTEEERNRIHFTRQEAHRYGLRLGNYVEGANAILQAPRLFIKTSDIKSEPVPSK